uniref:Protein PAM68, chloroplastic n=1 Tax=Lotus japonicus TaxID=34305 RepID=I3SKA4_LOTJA|nr:unknown [Lotus japonicus]
MAATAPTPFLHTQVRNNNILTLTKINYVSGNVNSQFHHHIHFSHLALVRATRGPKGFGPAPNKRKKPKKQLRKDKEEEDNDDDEEEEEEEDEEEEREKGVIPEVVTNRMMSGMAFSVGIPLGIGLLFFPFFYYLKVGLKIDVPTWVPFIVSFIFYGSALLGVSYGIVSTSWDPLREGSLLGWNEPRRLACFWHPFGVISQG